MGSGVSYCNFIRDHRVKKVQLTSDNQNIGNFIKAFNFRLINQPMALVSLRRPEEEESFISSMILVTPSEWAVAWTRVLCMAGLGSLLKGPGKMPSPLPLPAHFFIWSATKTSARNPPRSSSVPNRHLHWVTMTHQSKLLRLFEFYIPVAPENSVHTTTNEALLFTYLYLLLSAAASSHFRTQIVATPLPPVYLQSQGQAHQIPLSTFKSSTIFSNPSTPPLSSNYCLHMMAPQGGPNCQRLIITKDSSWLQ